MANCIRCSGEGKTNLWRFGNPGPNAGCRYTSYNSCLESNNPKNINISTDCLVFLNDNGGDLRNGSGSAFSLFLNQYADSNQQTPIPSQYGSPGTSGYINNTTNVLNLNEQNQRIWGYDFQSNTTYYLDTVNHRGTDIAATKNKLFLGCDFSKVYPNGGPLGSNSTIPTFTINEYDYTMVNNDPDTFSKTPTKTYRFVSPTGDLLALTQATSTGGQNTWSDNSRIGELDCLGNDLGVVDDRTLIFSDKEGFIYVANLDNLYTGESVKFGSTNGVVGAQGGTFPNTPTGPTDLSTVSYPLPGGGGTHYGYEQALYNCSEDTNYQVYTVIAQPIIDFRAAGVKTMGDIVFIPSDSNNGGDPTVIVTILASYAYSASLTKRFVRFAYPTNLNNVTIQTWANRITDSVAPNGAVALFKNTTTGQFYTIAARKRYEIDFNTLVYSNSLSMQLTTYDGQGFLQTLDAGTSGMEGWGVRGASQPVDCVTTTAYTYNCSIDGCVSVLGTGGNFATLNACTASCISWSCTTTCDCPDGYTYNETTENCELSTSYTVNSALFLNNAGNSSQYNNNNTYFYQKQGTDWYSVANKQGPILATANDASGFWGSVGDYLINAPLNAYGLWNSNFQDWLPGSQENWYGTSKCITVTGNTSQAYLIGLGAAGHFRMAVNNVMEVNTTTGINNFDPSGVQQGNDPVTSPLMTEQWRTWHVFKVILEPGDNTILLEGANPSITNPGFAFDIVGPFNSTDYDTAPEYLNLTTNTYTANTVYSTKNLAQIIASDNCDPSTTPAFPLYLGSTMYTTYPDPWRVSSAADDIIDLSQVLSLGLPAGHVPGWGLIDNDCTVGDPPANYTDNGNMGSCWALNQWQTGYLPWFAAGGTYTSPITQTTQLRRNMNMLWDFNYGQEVWTNINTMAYNSGLSTANPGTTLETIFGATIEYPNWLVDNQGRSDQFIFTCNHPGFTMTGLPPTATIGDCCDGGSLYGINGVYGPLQMIEGSLNPKSVSPNGATFYVGPFGSDNNGATVGSQPPNSPGGNPTPFPTWLPYSDTLGVVTCDGCPTGKMAYFAGFQDWGSFIDWLNLEGLTVSPIIDPTTGQQALIDYNADYWTVLRAVQTYWTPQDLQPAGSTNVLKTINGVASEPVSIFLYGSNKCGCTTSSGVFNTQVNYCNYPTVYDACTDTCVGTTACTLNYTLGFSGGCVSIEGTGKTGTYLTSGACEENCFSGFTYWECGNNGCSTAANGVITPFTSQTECERICTSFSCSTTGCETYNAGGGGGTGGTFTTLLDCDVSCKSWNCTNGFQGSGCQQQVGTGGTYTELTACTATCVSYECLPYGCWGYEGTGYTYNTLGSCTAACQTQECTYDGCGLFNPPPGGTVITPGIGNPNTYYGTGTSTTPNLYTTLSACTENCTSWGCSEYDLLTSSRQPNIYVYYDTSSMSVDITAAIEALSAWTQSIPGYTGKTYHTVVGNERWLQWGTAPWDAFSGVATAYGSSSVSFDVQSWAEVQGIATYPDGTSLIYDNWPVNTGNFGSVLVNGSLVNIDGQGIAPTAAVDDNVIVIVFCDESSGSPSYYVGNSETSWDFNITQNGKWPLDYERFKGRWTAGEANGATNQWLYYGATENFNYTIGPYSRSARNAIAAIFSGNTGNNDGLWLPGTAPAAFLSPNFCSVIGSQAANLLETSNPFVSNNLGLLEHYDWKMDYSFGPWNPSNFQSYLNTGLFNTTTVSGNSGCFSAATLPTEDFPFTSQTQCNSGFTYWNGELIRCSGFRCTNTGCIVVTGTTNTDWQYETYAQCTAACQSYDCTVTGCTTYNEPYFGTGGTYNSMIFCSSACTSYNCGTWEQGYGAIETWDGCIPQIGTGGTFYDANHLIVGSLASYSACTGSCISYNCTGACETTGTFGAAGYTANTGTCITWPNTGGTFTTMSACTANCQTHWWCVPETIVDTCDGRVTQYNLPYYLVDPTASPGATQQLTGPPNNPNSNVYFGNYIALAYQSSNITTLSFETFTNTPPANVCIGQYGYPIIAPQSINSNYVTGGPWYVWNDFIVAAQAQGLSVNNQMTYQQVLQMIGSHFQIVLEGTGMWMDYMYCFCTSTFNNVTCTTSILPPVVGATGPFATSGEAISNCYDTTWNCVEETFTNTCSGTTQLPGQYTGLTQVHDYVSSNLPNSTLTEISYESTEIQLLPNGCVGPNGYAIYKLQPLSYTPLNGGLDYPTYSTFITALSGQGATQLVPGMLYSSVNAEINTISGSSISLCQEPCICETNPCYCEEIIGTGGTYNTLSECNIQCDCVPTGTSWNCVNHGPYEPTCNNKPYMGEYYSQNDVVDIFRQNDPNVSFGTQRFTYNVQSFNPLVNGPILNYTTSTPSVWGLFSGSSYQWEDCYKYKVPDLFYPYTYIKSISHPLISGGTGILSNTGWSYQNWSSFYNAVVNAGVNINATMSFSSVCDTIDTTLASSSPAGGILQGCHIDFAYCCVDEDCYCYELFVTGGTYNNEPDCLSECCPERNRTGYTCDSILQTCVIAGPPVPPANYILYPTMLDCLAQLPKNCPPTMYDCITGATIYACDPSQPINQVSPGTIAGNGTPFIVNNPGYPFTSFTTTANQFGVLNGIGHAEQVLTNPIYLDPSVSFSSVTYEVSGTTNNPFTPPFNPSCFGPNGWPVFRMISIGHPQVNNGQAYYSWGDFVTAANNAGYPYSTTLPINDWGWNHWIVIVEECSCLTDQCDCVPVLGIGQYYTMAACEKECCTPRASWDCTITGCVDPGDGSGLFFGLNGLSDCINICKEYECHPDSNTNPGSQVSDDSCELLDEVPYPGTGVMDIIAHIGSPANPVLQNSPFGQMKFEIANFCHPPGTMTPCYGQNGLSLVYIEHIQAVITNNSYNIPTGLQITSWVGLIDAINQYCVNCSGPFTSNSQPQTTYQGSASVNCFDGSNVCFYNTQYEVPQFVATIACCECEDDCDCNPIIGTGHTGTYPFTPQGYNLCYSACCDEQSFNLCDVFLSVADKGVYQMDHLNGVITEASLIAGNQTYNDITMWVDGPLNSFLWLYNNNTITEYNITLNPWSLTFSRNISTNAFIGKGLTTYDQNTLISADNWVRSIDITPPLVNANISLMFQLPSWCLGDIIWDSISQQFLIAYSTLPVTNVSQKIGKFNYTGTLQDEYTVPGGVFEPNEKIDGLYKKGGFNNSCRNFVVTNKGRVFDIIDPLLGSLTLSPVPSITTNDPINPSVQTGIDSLNTPVTGAANAEGPIFSEENCGCIRKRETFNCEQDITSNPPSTNCVDPGDGSGQFTPITASLNGYASALLECQDNCPFSCITWDCIPGEEINSCAGVQYTLPYPQVNSEGTALDYISNGNWPGSHLTPFSNIQFELPQTTTNGCTGANGLPLFRISYIVSPWNGAHYYSWQELIDAMNLAFPSWLGAFPYTFNLAQVMQVLTQYNWWTPKVVTTPCICEGVPCHCIPVIGLTGQYTTESLCLTKCCPIEPIEEGYDCIPTIGTGQQSTCVPCTGPNCPYTTTGALALGYPTALSWCQDYCGEVTRTGWYCELVGYPCVPCQNPTPNGPCYVDPDDCYLACTQDTPSPCPPLDQNSPYYTNNVEFCYGCDNSGSFYFGHVDCPCCKNKFTPEVRYCGLQEEVAVKISEYTGTKLNVVTSEMVVAVEDVASQIVRNKQSYETSNCDSCGGTLETHATCLDSGCLSITNYKEDGTSEVCWTTVKKPNQENRTYDCIDGSCIEIGNGRFNSMSDCIKECNDITNGRNSRNITGDKSLVLPPVAHTPMTSTQPTSTSPVVVVESNFYICQNATNPVVSENQKSCVPVNEFVTGAFTNLVDCLNSGCGGWITPTTNSNINANGIIVKPNQIAPIGMCCESYISKATTPLTIESCSSYCCDGTDTWYPLYNANGINNVINSPLSYTNSVINSLITSKTAEVSSSKSNYERKGYSILSPYSRNSILRCGNEIIGYIDNRAVYSTIADALNEASSIGCEGYHEHVVNGRRGYMACNTHSSSNARMTAGGPCICRQYQTGPDGLSKCIKWSPPGCGDAPFMTANEPNRAVATPRPTGGNTPTGTRTSMGSSRVARGGMSSGGGGY